MQLEGALIREQGVEFAIVIVKKFVLDNSSRAGSMASQLHLHFGRPVVLMAQDSRGIPTYVGRRDLVRFLVSVPMTAIPWRRFTI
jgi:hypothetical protein